jgi:hypothetical protein
MYSVLLAGLNAKRSLHSNLTSKDHIMATRTKTQPAPAIESVAEPIMTPNDEASFSYMEFMRSMASMTGIEIPSGKQLLAATIVGLAGGILGGYIVGSLATYVFAGALIFTGSAFIAFIAMVLTFIVGVYAASIASSRAAMYVATGKLETDVVRAKDWVVSKFAGLTKSEVTVQVPSFTVGAR